MGAARHVVRLNNLYDTKSDPLGLVKKNRGATQAERASNLERAIMRAGFDGYLADTGANQSFIAGASFPFGVAVHAARASSAGADFGDRVAGIGPQHA